MFVLASAIVAFHGWPQIGEQSSTPNVAAPGVALASSSPTGRILHAALTSRLGLAATGIAGSGSLGPHLGAGAGAGGSTGGEPGAPSSTSISGKATGVGAHGSTGPQPTSCVGSLCTPAIPTSVPVDTLTGTAAKTLSDTGKQVGSAVSSATNSASGALSGVSPPTGGTLKGTGTAVGNTVATATGYVAGTLSHGSHLAPGLSH
jgi:hypothetical protein